MSTNTTGAPESTAGRAAGSLQSVRPRVMRNAAALLEGDEGTMPGG